jgi:hypothetical protein
MAAMWDLVSDSNYGVIGNAQNQNNYSKIDEQGWYLAKAAHLMPGHQVRATTAAANLQVLASTRGKSFSIQLVNCNLTQTLSPAIALSGGTLSGPVTRWELSTRYPNGHTSTTASLAQVQLPPQSIVILSGNTAPPAVAPDARQPHREENPATSVRG